MSIVAVYITTKDEEEAKKIGRILLEKRLVACVNIVPRIQSLYWWEGKIQDESEALLIAKAPAGKEDEIIRTVKENHSYSMPCVNFLPVLKGNPDYIKWIKEETKG